MRRVAIVARAPSTRYQAPFHDETFEIWTLSPMCPSDGFTDLPRFDRWYEIHPLGEKEAQCPGYTEFLASHKDKVWVREGTLNVPDALVLPHREILAKFDENFIDVEFRYYTNQVSWMMAHALHEGVDELHIYGCDMAQFTEYASQRPSCEFFVGYAVASGVKVYLPPECDMLKASHLYGIEDDRNPIRGVLDKRGRELEGMIAEARSTFQDMQSQHFAASGAMQELTAMNAMLNGELLPEGRDKLANRLEQLKQMVKQMEHELRGIDEKVKMCTGAIEEWRYERQHLCA